MRAWLITWDWCGDYAKVADPLIAVFSSRRSERRVAEYVEEYYLHATSSADEVAYYANRVERRPYKANARQFAMNGVPHGGRIACGHNPFVYARMVSDLVVQPDVEQGIETLRWQEPPTFKWKDERQLQIELDREGERAELIREAHPLIPV